MNRPLVSSAMIQLQLMIGKPVLKWETGLYGFLQAAGQQKENTAGVCQAD